MSLKIKHYVQPNHKTLCFPTEVNNVLMVSSASSEGSQPVHDKLVEFPSLF